MITIAQIRDLREQCLELAKVYPRSNDLFDCPPPYEVWANGFFKDILNYYEDYNSSIIAELLSECDYVSDPREVHRVLNSPEHPVRNCLILSSINCYPDRYKVIPIHCPKQI